MGETVTLFLCGDVMTGRGVAQILVHPNPPDIHESRVRDARDYVTLAEAVNGPIPRRVDGSYVRGDALAELDRIAPDARIINLETSMTSSDAYWPGKGIHYRMHPANIASLTAARIDVCTLGNNHVLDYGYAGLMDTLDTLHHAGVRTAGAGRDLVEAHRPAIVDLPHDRRVVVFSLASETSGVPEVWSAMGERGDRRMHRRAGRERVVDQDHRAAGAPTRDTSTARRLALGEFGHAREERAMQPGSSAYARKGAVRSGGPVARP
jgi:poly-gamma-glutamate capsule biosynthesis protein CapA/YwtB (metallophosphatase superfamily)